MDVAVVQGNVPRALASDRLLQSDQVALNHIDLNRTLASDSAGPGGVAGERALR